MFVFFGRYNDVLAYPRFIASYATASLFTHQWFTEPLVFCENFILSLFVSTGVCRLASFSAGSPQTTLLPIAIGTNTSGRYPRP
jgi:hypothetical protein